MFISDEDIVIVALRGLFPKYNIIKAVIQGRENLVSLKELRSRLRVEESNLDETTKQIPLMSAMHARTSGSIFDNGSSSCTKPYIPGSDVGSTSRGNFGNPMSFSPMPFPPQFVSLPFLSQFPQLSLPGP